MSNDIVLFLRCGFKVIIALGICLLYIMMQTFAIPGTLSMTLLSGAVFGTMKGLILVTGNCAHTKGMCKIY